MNSLSSIFWLLVLVLVLYVGIKIVPIYYRGVVGIKAVCKENADIYHKYGSGYVNTSIPEALEDMGIPKDKRKYSVSVKNDNVNIWIYYNDTANFADYYVKNFEFEYECSGVLKSVYK